MNESETGPSLLINYMKMKHIIIMLHYLCHISRPSDIPLCVLKEEYYRKKINAKERKTRYPSKATEWRQNKEKKTMVKKKKKKRRKKETEIRRKSKKLKTSIRSYDNLKLLKEKTI